MFVSAAGTASILHADLDSFYASVEQRDDAALRGRPVAVGGGGVVLAASYEAKRYGVRTPMPGHQAKRLCPDLVFVDPHFDKYVEASRAVFAIFDDVSPIVEGISIDEAFIDVSGLRRLAGTPVEIATKLRADVLAGVGLPITVGIARTKFLAKVASGVGKPDGLLVVEPDGELAFLHPLPVQALWGVGIVTATKLNARGIFTVGDVAKMPATTLESIAGVASGRQLHALSRNLDPRVVTVGTRRGSIGSQQALGRRARTRDEIEVILRRLVDRVTRRMRSAHRIGRTVTLRFRFENFTRATRSHTLPHPTSATAPIEATALGLLDASWSLIEVEGLTLIGLSLGQLRSDDVVQVTLPFEKSEAEQVDTVVDAIRDRFGTASLNRAASVGTDVGFTVPMLPD
ncbi:MAG: DNA polymerase IV [Ilumatobacter sp.]|nr:DNA polymerase IV [Ilumatobacter sp.]